MIDNLKKELKKLASSTRAASSARYFKTYEGGYAQSDKFYGLTVPVSRSIAKKYYEVLTLKDIEDLLKSEMHEERLIALLVLILQKSTNMPQNKILFDFYVKHTQYVNNWDLVDVSADKIVGDYLYETSRDSSMLRKLAVSDDLWERRIAILSTFAFLRRNDDKPTYEIADILLHDKHDLIHKAVGWLLREAGKRVSLEEEEAFLKTRYKTMPRTMLRYAIERFPEEKRKAYLQGSV